MLAKLIAKCGDKLYSIEQGKDGWWVRGWGNTLVHDKTPYKAVKQFLKKLEEKRNEDLAP